MNVWMYSEFRPFHFQEHDNLITQSLGDLDDGSLHDFTHLKTESIAIGLGLLFGSCSSCLWSCLRLPSIDVYSEVAFGSYFRSFGLQGTLTPRALIHFPRATRKAANSGGLCVVSIGVDLL
jgi:hypothetical protein